MSRYHSYIKSALGILRAYNGEEPFPAFLKKFFAGYKKAGSRDRKEITQLCYAYFRTGLFLGTPADEEKLMQALFLCSNQPGGILEALRPEMVPYTGLSLVEKLAYLGYGKPVTALFPWADQLSAGTDSQLFAESLLVQPDVFIRIRPGKIKNLTDRLNQEQVPYRQPATDCIAFPPAIKLDTLFTPDRDAVIQDYSSQRVGELLADAALPAFPEVWDACAASGGKSIMAADRLNKPKLTVSDIRKSMLHNLENRLRTAGVTATAVFTADLAAKDPLPADRLFDLVIADVPCSGSGTWSRTPEQLFYYDPDKTAAFSSLQQKIVSVLIPHIRPGGYLLYITCSVFSAENEANIDAVMAHSGDLQKISQQLITGYTEKADSMFACLLQKQL